MQGTFDPNLRKRINGRPGRILWVSPCWGWLVLVPKEWEGWTIEKVCRVPERQLVVAKRDVGGGVRPCSSEVREDMESQTQCNCISQDRSLKSGGKSSQTAKTNLVAETKELCDVNPSCAKSHPVFPKVKTPLENCVPRRHTCGTSALAKTLREHQTQLNTFLSPETR